MSNTSDKVEDLLFELDMAKNSGLIDYTYSTFNRPSLLDCDYTIYGTVTIKFSDHVKEGAKIELARYLNTRYFITNTYFATDGSPHIRHTLTFYLNKKIDPPIL